MSDIEQRDAAEAALRIIQSQVKDALSGLYASSKSGQADPVGPTKALFDVMSERVRQREVEGWTPEHDDQHNAGELALAAGAYCQSAAKPTLHARKPGGAFSVPMCWPSWWGLNWWKPTGSRADLVKAGALILAEIERLDRAAAKSAEVKE